MVKNRILYFSDFFMPGFKAGGPIKSIYNLVKSMDLHYKTLIITRDRDFGDKTNYIGILQNTIIKKFSLNISYLSHIKFFQILRIIKKFNPDIIHLNSYFSKFTIIVLLINFLFRFHFKIIISPRGELKKHALSIKRIKKYLFIFFNKFFFSKNNIYFHSTSNDETRSIKSFYPSQIFQISNLSGSFNDFRLKWKKKNMPLRIIFISRIRDNKNLLFCLKVFTEIQNIKIIFHIYGPIEDQKYWNKCKRMIDELPNNIRVKYKGIVASIDVQSKMSEYHALFLPTKTENFGHVIVEAMQVGLIPIISDQTPWKKLEKFNAGWAIDLKKKNKFIEAVELISYYKNEDFNKKVIDIKKYIGKKINTDQIIQKYQNMYNQIL